MTHKHEVTINGETGEYYFYYQIQDMYEDMLDECYEPVDICGHKYDAGRALKLVDEVAFRCGCADYHSELLSDGWYEAFMTYDELTEHSKKVQDGTWVNPDEEA